MGLFQFVAFPEYGTTDAANAESWVLGAELLNGEILRIVGCFLHFHVPTSAASLRRWGDYKKRQYIKRNAPIKGLKYLGG